MSPVDTKTQILDVAQDLIQRLGVNGMSYQDISDRVGIRKASVHSHFPKKDDLLLALVERYSDRFLRIVDGILASDDGPEVKLRRYCGLFEATLSSGNQDKTCLSTMLGAETLTLSASLVEDVWGFCEANEQHLATMLEQGRQEGSFHFSGEVQAMAALMFETLQGGMLLARVRGGATGFHQTIGQLMQLVKG
jgi:TetR/AcrR family transcriptional regulator, transcriptional repressor for nem operon